MKHCTALLAMIAWAAVAGILNAQPQPPAFEVASVKVNKSGDGVNGTCRGIDSGLKPNEGPITPVGRCVIRSARLSHLISIAFRIQSMDLIKSGPEWIQRGYDRYDVDAKAE